MSAWNRNLAAANLAIAERNTAALYQMPLSSIADRAGCPRLNVRTIRTNTNGLAKQKKIKGCTLAEAHRPIERQYLGKLLWRTPTAPSPRRARVARERPPIRTDRRATIPRTEAPALDFRSGGRCRWWHSSPLAAAMF